MKIIQIVACADRSWSAVYGLGDDGLIYVYSFKKMAWVIPDSSGYLPY